MEEVELQRADLLKVLIRASYIVSRRSVDFIMTHVLLKISHKTLLVVACDNADGLWSESCEVESDSSWTVAVPAHLICDIVRKIPAGSSITLKKSESTSSLEIHAGSSFFSVSMLSGENFPVWDSGELLSSFSLPLHRLFQLIEKTKCSVALTATRRAMTGLYFHACPSEGGVRLVSTDGHRLSLVSEKVEVSPDLSFVVPRRTIYDLARLVSSEFIGTEDVVHVQWFARFVQFSWGNGRFIFCSRLIDAVYPQYEPVIFDGNNVDSVIFSVSDLANATDRVATLSQDQLRCMCFTVTENNLRVSVSNAGVVLAREDVSVDYTGKGGKFFLNFQYFLDALSTMGGKAILFFSTEDSMLPVKLRPFDDDSHLCAIMPMNASMQG